MTFRGRAGLAFLALLGAASLGAAPLDEIKSASSLPPLDFAKLKFGEIISARGPIGNFPRGVYAESVFFVHAPTETTGARLLHWDPTKHRENEVRTYREYQWPAATETWASLQLSAQRGDDRWLLERTKQKPADLNLNPADHPHGSTDAEATQFWRSLLRTRNDALAAGGLPALPAITGGSSQINPRSEFNSLLKMAPAAAARFAPLTDCFPFATSPNKAAETIPYWEAALVRGHTNLHAGFLAERKAGESTLVADCTYYTSDTYFFSVTLYQLWPVENGTLVWEIDFASAPFRSFTGGIDRAFAGNQMVKETAATARLFRADVEGR